MPYTEISGLILGLILVIGFILLFIGGEVLCKGAESLALRLKVNPVIIGLTIVASATSMPELVTSMYGAAIGSEGIAVGNIVGSNIVNVSLILGVAALIKPLTIHAQLIKKEVPILILVTAVFSVFCFNGSLSRVKGILLFLGFVIYTFYVIKSAKSESKKVKQEIAEDLESERRSLLYCWAFIIGGTICLHFGADFLVNTSIEFAHRVGISEMLIGLTLVAVGTSLPELATSLSAAMRGQFDICVGNIVGSNIFNILFIGGSVAAIFPLEFDRRLVELEIPAMFLLTIVLLWFFVTENNVKRWEGFVLVVMYVVIIILTAFKELGYFHFFERT